MLKFTQGDIFAANAQALVNPVNCVGVMGAGLALAFKRRFPENFLQYAEACRRQEVATGKLFVTEAGTHPRWLVNFPTKQHWRNPSRLEWIAEGLSDLARVLRDRKITSVAIPALGAGLGGLTWDAVRREIEEALQDVDCEILVFEPQA